MILLGKEIGRHADGFNTWVWPLVMLINGEIDEDTLTDNEEIRDALNRFKDFADHTGLTEIGQIEYFYAQGKKIGRLSQKCHDLQGTVKKLEKRLAGIECWKLEKQADKLLFDRENREEVTDWEKQVGEFCKQQNDLKDFKPAEALSDSVKVNDLREQAVAISDSIKESFEKLGDEFDKLFDADGTASRKKIDEWITEQEELQKEGLEVQERCYEAVKNYFNHKHKLSKQEADIIKDSPLTILIMMECRLKNIAKAVKKRKYARAAKQIEIALNGIEILKNGG